jgi:hypothetical protein
MHLAEFPICGAYQEIELSNGSKKLASLLDVINLRRGGKLGGREGARASFVARGILAIQVTREYKPKDRD